jgi:hypothetical protein
MTSNTYRFSGLESTTLLPVVLAPAVAGTAASGFLLALFGSLFLALFLTGAGASSPESSKAAKKFWDCNGDSKLEWETEIENNIIKTHVHVLELIMVEYPASGIRHPAFNIQSLNSTEVPDIAVDDHITSHTIVFERIYTTRP